MSLPTRHKTFSVKKWQDTLETNRKINANFKIKKARQLLIIVCLFKTVLPFINVKIDRLKWHNTFRIFSTDGNETRLYLEKSNKVQWTNSPPPYFTFIAFSLFVAMHLFQKSWIVLAALISAERSISRFDK